MDGDLPVKLYIYLFPPLYDIDPPLISLTALVQIQQIPSERTPFSWLGKLSEWRHRHYLMPLLRRRLSNR